MWDVGKPLPLFCPFTYHQLLSTQACVMGYRRLPQRDCTSHCFMNTSFILLFQMFWLWQLVSVSLQPTPSEPELPPGAHCRWLTKKIHASPLLQILILMILSSYDLSQSHQQKKKLLVLQPHPPLVTWPLQQLLQQWRHHYQTCQFCLHPQQLQKLSL